MVFSGVKYSIWISFLTLRYQHPSFISSFTITLGTRLVTWSNPSKKICTNQVHIPVIFLTWLFNIYSVLNTRSICLDHLLHSPQCSTPKSVYYFHYILGQCLCRPVCHHASSTHWTYPVHSSFCLSLGYFPDRGIPHRRRSTGACSGNRRRWWGWPGRGSQLPGRRGPPSAL